MDSLVLLQQLVSLPAPPGQEHAVRDFLLQKVREFGYEPSVDAKGNLLVHMGKNDRPKVVVTAHMDEIAMIVRRIEEDGCLTVAPLGGLFAWKLGEGPVQVLCGSGPLDGVLSFGSIHTEDQASAARQSESAGVDFEQAVVVTGKDPESLVASGVRPGTRVVVHPSRRNLIQVGPLVAGYFLDDRADLVSWLMCLEQLRDLELDVLFAATASEEVGGEGALYLLQNIRPGVCIALELGPNAIDAQVELTDQPTVWANDSYSAMSYEDGELLAALGSELGMELQFQALSRGGSDASCAASHGLCARPITLGLPMDNTHGFELMHPEAMDELARLTVELLKRIC